MTEPTSRMTHPDSVNHPSHYNQQPIEVIDMMQAIYGIAATIDFCTLNAFKYRMRAGYKDDAQQDIQKAMWYEAKAKEIANKTKQS